MNPALQRVLLRLYPLVRRVAPGRHLPWPVFGGRIYLDVGESLMMYQRALGVYEPDKVHLIRELLQPGMSFVDVGANKGYFSLLAASILGTSERIVAVEPEPTNYYWLRRTLCSDRYPEVSVVQAAVGSAPGKGHLYLGEKSGWHSLIRSGDRQHIEVNLTTLDELTHHSGLETVDMIKIDVEGSELEVLQGARGTIERNSSVVVLIDLHPHLGVDLEEFSGVARSLELRMFDIRDPLTEIETPSTPQPEILLRK